MDIFDVINFIPFIDSFSFIVGAFVAWNFPQPMYAKVIQDFVIRKYKEWRAK
jgi:hypothetical protein